MGFRVFLEKLQNFLQTGVLDIPGRECQVQDPVQRLVVACSLFERESYKNLGNVTTGQYAFFSQIFLKALLAISVSEFEQKVSSLDFKSRDYLLRGIEYASREFPNLVLADYSRFL